MKMICNNCGYTGDTKFCPNCGTKMTEQIFEDGLSVDRLSDREVPSEQEISSSDNNFESIEKQSTDLKDANEKTDDTSYFNERVQSITAHTDTELKSEKKSKGKKALKIIGIVLGVLILALVVLMLIPIDEEVPADGSFPEQPINTELSGMFDKSTAKSFKVDGIKFYVPKEWDIVESFTTEEGEELDETKAVYINPDATNGITYPVYYYVKVSNRVSDHEGLSFNGWINIIKDNLDGVYNIENTTISGCDNAATFEILDTEKKSRGYAIECGDSHILVLMVCCDPAFYDINEYDTIVKSADYGVYAKKHPYSAKAETEEKTETTTKATTKATTETTTKATTKATTSKNSGGNGFGTEVTDVQTKRNVWICAQDVVKQDLESPSSAKFCKEYEATVYHQNGDQYIAMGYVDADNAYGANIRTRFAVWLTMTETGYKDAHAEYDQ